MKKKIWLSLLCALSFSQLAAKEAPSTSPQQNLRATNQYYTQLALGKTPHTAELTLFSTLLPKGGDLHHHYSGAIYAETYLDWVGAQHYCVYRASNAELDIEKFRIEAKPQALSEAARAICISAEAVRQDNAFYRELLTHWSDKDYDNHYHEQLPPDQQFFDTFGYFGPVSGFDYAQGLQMLKERAKAENLGYLETMLKSSPSIEDVGLDNLLNTMHGDAAPQDVATALGNAFDMLAKHTDVEGKVDAYLASLENAARGLDDETFKLRFQAYVSRNSPPARVFSCLYTAFAAAKRSKLLVGVNIVGPENGYVAMRDYRLHMQMFAFLKQRFPSVKLSLHAGELALGMVPPEGLRTHIREAVLVAGADRIGHGVDIAHESDAPGLLNIMKQRKVALEVNLSSNAFILGIKNEAHPAPLYTRYGVPIVLSTDDAGVSRNNLSGEYQLYISRYKPSYSELKQIVYNSIRYSFLPEDEKQVELAKLAKRFVVFEKQVAGWPRIGR